MRTTLLPLFFLLLSFSPKPLPGAAHSDPVLDTSGNPLLPGDSYYILPVTGGPFVLAGYEDDTCPLLVVQRDFYYPSAPPVTFSPANPEARVIHTSMNLNVKFTRNSTTCPDSSMVWRLLKRISEALFISTDGVEGNPSFETLSNWFMIEKADNGVGYKLKFCPTEICHCGVTCSDLGIYVGDDNKRYLGLADKLEPISVVFKRDEPKILQMSS